MEIIEAASGRKLPVVVRLVEDEDFKILTEKRYSFDWRMIKGSAVIYKLQIEGKEAILGVYLENEALFSLIKEYFI